MVTHDPIAAAHADRVVFLVDGRIVDEGFVTATSGSGERGTYDFTTAEVEIPFDGVGALIVFAAWVSALGALALLSGRKPLVRPAATAPARGGTGP